MRSNRKILAGAALLGAVLLVYGLYTYTSNLGSSNQLAASATPTPSAIRPVAVSSRRIAVAAVDIPERAIITREMLKWKDYSGANESAFVTDFDTQAIGFVTRVPIVRNSEIRPANDFVGHLSETGIAGALRPGTRALVIPIPNKTTLHDLVRIGNSIDVLASFDQQEARTIVENVRVLAVDLSGNDYPNVNVAMRGPFKADAKNKTVQEAQATGQIQVDASGQPIPTAAPTPLPPNTPRPDAALTLEVTPTQAATIQLALQSNAALDYLLRPTLPGNRSGEATLVASDGTPVGGATGSAGGIRPVSVTKVQIAPYAERRKAQGGTSAARPAASGGGTSGGGSGNLGGGGGSASTRRVRYDDTPVIPPGEIKVVPPPAPGEGNPPFGGGTGAGTTTPSAPPAAQTYDIPIYADGKVVRTETVRLPQN